MQHFSLAVFLLEDNIEARPACFYNKLSVGRLDFLYTELAVMVDVFC